jgi:hypothetical protein
MAGLWIPWEIGLERKREVLRIAHKLGITPTDVAGRCMVVWVWAQDQTDDGLIEGISPAMVSQAVGLPGIAEAMLDEGWLGWDGRFLQFASWERWNSQSSKKRAKDAERKRKFRDCKPWHSKDLQ